FVDGGQLPSPGTDAIGTQRFPQVFGDPDVRYLGACNFIYSSIILTKFSPTTAAETMGVHRSTDCGHTWTGPFEVTAATNPNGFIDRFGSPVDAADKEFMSVDPDTGRVLMSWSNFTNPAVVPSASRGPHRGNVYVVYGNNNTFDGADVVFQRSMDDGVTFSAPIYLNSRPGEDRAQWFPWVAVDATTGRVNVFYYDQDVDASGDVTAVSWQYSNDGGLSWNKPMALTARAFHAGHGNDTGQPNLGDYNQAVATQNQPFAAYAS